MFTGLDTERLRLRPYTADDVDSLTALRNDPDVARYQTWELPYDRGRAERLIASLPDGPAPDDWWHVAVCERDTDRYVGDLCFGFSFGLRSAEIGYSFLPAYWGRGYAFEAAAALVGHVIATVAPTRVWGMLHPDNRPSAMLLERLGMRFEGHTRNSFWVGEDNSDDWIYAMTPDEWQQWRDRPRHPPSTVDLVPVTFENSVAVRRLVTHKSQERFVSPMLYSYADALFPEPWEGHEVVPVLRAVVADGETVGFVMYSAIAEGQPDPYLWRFLVDRRHQSRGIGRRALQSLYEELRATGATAVMVSWVPGRGSPEQLYLSEGFVPTGEIEDGETVARRPL